MRKELKKKVFRVFTFRTWRWKRRKKIFQVLFEDLKHSHEGRGSFTSVKDGLSYDRACRAMARTHDYNPMVDDEYGLMNIGKYFDKYQSQDFESLYAVIRRISSPWNFSTPTFEVEFSGRQNGEIFDFSYVKRVVI